LWRPKSAFPVLTLRAVAEVAAVPDLALAVVEAAAA
jgi:hypothetical protein